MTPTLRLTIIEPADYPQASRVHAITGGSLRIGRESDNDWVISDSARLMSRHHCTIDFKGGVYVVIDTSANGVFLNGKAQPIGRGNSSVLSEGDRLRFPGIALSVSLLEHEDARDAFRAVLPPQPGGDAFGASSQAREPLDDLLAQPTTPWRAPGFTTAPFAPMPLSPTSFDGLAMSWSQADQAGAFGDPGPFNEAAGGSGWPSAGSGPTAWPGPAADIWGEASAPTWSVAPTRSSFEDRSPPEQQAFQSALPGQTLIPEDWDNEDPLELEMVQQGLPGGAPAPFEPHAERQAALPPDPLDLLGTEETQPGLPENLGAEHALARDLLGDVLPPAVMPDETPYADASTGKPPADDGSGAMPIPVIGPAWLANEPAMIAPTTTAQASEWPTDVWQTAIGESATMAPPDDASPQASSAPVSPAPASPQPTPAVSAPSMASNDSALLLAMASALGRIERSIARPGDFVLLDGDTEALLGWLRTLDPLMVGQSIADIGERALAALRATTHDALAHDVSSEMIDASPVPGHAVSDHALPVDWASEQATARPAPGDDRS